MAKNQTQRVRKRARLQIDRDRIIRERLSRGMLRREFAAFLGVNASAITRIEHDGPVGIALLSRVAQVLEIPVNDLVRVERVPVNQQNGEVA